MSPEEGQKLVIDAMISSGASIEEVSKALAHSSVLEAVGDSPDAVARSLLGAMRSCEDVTIDVLAKALGRGGVELESAQKALLFQKALGACGSDPEDVARALLLQKALVSGGAPPSVAAKLMKEVTAGGRMTEAEAETMLREMADGDLNYDDIMKGLKLDKTLSGPKGADMELVQEVMKGLGKNPTREELAAAAVKLAASFGVDPKGAASAAALQKVMAQLGVEASDVSKILAVQKKMYESGASPQDIAMVLQAAFDSGEDDEDDDGGDGDEARKRRDKMLDALTAAVINSTLSGADIAAASDLAGAAANQGVPAEVVKSVAMMQKTIESALKSPERSAKEAAAKIRAGGGSEGEVAGAVKDLLRENDLSSEALAEGVLMQRALHALGVKPEDFAAVLKLQQGMADAGKSKVDVAQVLETLAAKAGSDLKNMADSLLSALEGGGGRIKDEDMRAFSDIVAAALDPAGGGADDEVMARLRKELSGAKTRAGMVEAIERAMTQLGVSHESVAKTLLVQKMMSDAGARCSPQDLAKLCRIQKSLSEAGVPPGAIPRAVAAILEDEKVQTTAEKARSRLKEVSRSGKLEVKGEMLDFASKFGGSLKPGSEHSEEDVRKVLEAGAEAAGLTGDDLARAMLVQKTLAATGVTPEALSQLVLLQKTLAAAGKNPEEIAQFLSDAVGKGLSQGEVADIMASALSNPNLTEEDVKKMMQLQESLQKGFVQATGVSPEKLSEVLRMQSVLEKSGVSQEEVADLMSKITSGDLDEKEVDKIMAKALQGQKLDKDTLDSIVSAKSALKDGSLAGVKVDAPALKQLSNIQESLQNAGVSSEEIEAILEKVASGAVNEEEAKKILEKMVSKDSVLGGVEKKIAGDMESLLKSKKLQSTGLKAEKVDLLLTLSDALSGMGKTEQEVQDILAKVAGGELTEEEVDDLVRDLESEGQASGLSQRTRDRLSKVAGALKSNSLKVDDESDREVLGEIVLLAKVLRSSGESADDVGKLVEKAMTKGLSGTDVTEAMKKVRSGVSSVSLGEKEVMDAVRKVLASDQDSLSKSSVDAEKADKLLKLSDALAAAGHSQVGSSLLLVPPASLEYLLFFSLFYPQEEISRIVQKAAQGTLSKGEVNTLVKELSAVGGGDPADIQSLCDSLKAGEMKVKGGVGKDFVEDLLFLSKVLDSSGISAEEKREIIRQKVGGKGGGMTGEQVDRVMAVLGDKVGGMVEERRRLGELEKAMTTGQLSQTGGLRADAAEKVAAVGEALVSAGIDAGEAAKLMTKAAKGELSEKELTEVLAKVAAGMSNLRPEAKEKRLAELEKTLREGSSALGDAVADMSEEALKETVALASAMKKAGASADEISKVLSKATGEGLTEKEVAQIVKKVMDSPNLTKEEKSQMAGVGEALRKGKLRSCQVSEKAIGATLALQGKLEAAGLDSKEISEVMASMAAKNMSEEEVRAALADVAKSHNLNDRQVKDIMKAVDEVSKAGGIQMPNASEETMEQVLLLKKVLEASGASKEKVAETIAKAVNQGLTKGEIGEMMKKAASSKNLSKADKAKLAGLQSSLERDELKTKASPSGTSLTKAIAAQKLLEESGLSPEEVADVMAKAARGEKLDDKTVEDLVKEVLKNKDVSEEDFKSMEGMLESLKSGGLKVPGLSPEIMDQVLLLKRTMEASGYTQGEIDDVVARATGQQGLSDTAASELMSRLMGSENLSEEDKEKLQKLQKDLRDGSLRIGGSAEDILAGIMAGGGPEALAKALLAQKVLARSGLSQDDLGKVVMLQKGLLESGASPEAVAKAMREALERAEADAAEADGVGAGPEGSGLDAVLKQMEEELRAAVEGGGDGGAPLSAADVAGALQFDKVLGASRAAEIAMRKLPPKQKKLLEQLIKGEAKDDISGDAGGRGQGGG